MKSSPSCSFNRKGQRTLAVLLLLLLAQVSVVAHGLGHDSQELSKPCQICVVQELNSGLTGIDPPTVVLPGLTHPAKKASVEAACGCTILAHNPRAPPLSFYS